MSKKTIYLFIILSLPISILKAQDSAPPKWQFHASYYSLNVTQPGLKIGAETPFFNRIKTKTSRKGIEKLSLKQAYYGGNLGYYYLSKTSHNYFLEAVLGYSRTGRKHFIHGVEFGLMYIQSFNYGKTYTVSEDNSVKQVKLASNPYLAPKLSYEFGYGITEQLSLGIKPGVFIQTMHYHSYIPQVTVEFKVTYKLNK